MDFNEDKSEQDTFEQNSSEPDKLAKLTAFKAKVAEKLEAWFLYSRDDSEAVKAKAKRNVHIALGACGCLLLGLLFLIGSCSLSETEPTQAGETVYFRVLPGMTSSEITDQLLEEGVIDSSFKFWLTVKLNGADSKFQTGIFELHKNMSPGDALEALVNGHAVAVRVTIPEGLNVTEVAKLFAEKGLADEKEFLAEAKDFAPYDYIQKAPEADYAIEGFLFPDTYEFANDATPRDIMEKMAAECDARLTPEIRRQAAEKGLSVQELITLASLVEKEARYPEDRPMVAQVFLKRLKINMPLQTDTTLQYLLDEIKEDLTIADTKIDSPYNTYQHYGLPPGPIASPGMASIEAVVQPADTDYLYFVADRQGHNHYSSTYDEHMANVEQVR